jgi:hypothetical protein
LNKRRLIILSIIIICISSIAIAVFYWRSERGAEERLQEYIRRLQDSGFTTEEHELADFQIGNPVRIHYFGDFRSFAEQEDVSHIYYDRGIHALYFLRSTDSGTEANVFYYK